MNTSNTKGLLKSSVLLSLVFLLFLPAVLAAPCNDNSTSCIPGDWKGFVFINGTAATNGTSVELTGSSGQLYTSTETRVITYQGNDTPNFYSAALALQTQTSVFFNVCGIPAGQANFTSGTHTLDLNVALQNDSTFGCTCSDVCGGGFCVNPGLTTGVCNDQAFYCDNDNVCEAAYGETTATCPADCATPAQATTGGGGGGGGGLAPTTGGNVLKEIDLTGEEQEESIQSAEQITFTIDGVRYYIRLSGVSEDSVRVRITSEGFTTTPEIGIGDFQVFDLNNNGEDDLLVSVNEVDSGLVVLGLSNLELAEEPESQAENTQPDTTPAGETLDGSEDTLNLEDGENQPAAPLAAFLANPLTKGAGIVVLVLALGGIFIAVYRKFWM